MKKAMFYVVAALLLFGYFAVFFKSMETSNTSIAYRMFYLTDELKYCISEEELESYCENIEFAYQADGNYMNQGEGWSSPEEEATWTVGKQSSLYININDLVEKYTFEINAISEVGYDNFLFVNGISQGKIIFKNGISRINISGVLHEGINTFMIATEEDVRPYNQVNPEAEDTKELNIYIHSVSLIGD